MDRHGEQEPAGEGLGNHLQRWAGAGLITAEQATAIAEWEAARDRSSEQRRLPLVAEALGYLGASLALIAAGALVSQFWADLEIWAKLALLGLATVVLWAAGQWIRHGSDPAVRRLSSFLWFLSAGGLAYVAGVVADDVLATATETTTLLIGLATTAYAGVLWRARPAAVQQVALFAGILVAVGGVLGLLEPSLEEFYGLAFWAVGLAWALLGWGGLVPPLRAAYVLGALAMLIGAQIFSFGELRGWALLLGLASSTALIAASISARQTALLALGAAGLFVFVPQGVFEYFGDTLGGPMALFLAGLSLLAIALVTARLRERVQS
ncbi:MAG: DUF2157 domain-containing protein [Actinomycetota bacterium]|nr:DUF2157 domain-containing protein [Actinomycetota bacterium]